MQASSSFLLVVPDLILEHQKPAPETSFPSYRISLKRRYELSVDAEGGREAVDVVLEGTDLAEELAVSTIGPDLARGTHHGVFLAAERSEAPVLGDDDLLATRELVHRAAKGLDGGSAIC